MSLPQVEVTPQTVQAITDRVSQVFAIESVVTGKPGEPTARYRGTFRVPADQAYSDLSPTLRDLGFTPMFRRDREGPIILVLPGRLVTQVSSSPLNIILLVLTILSTLFVGTMMVSNDPSDLLARPWLGLPFALSLLVILGAHELGHYFAARQYGVPVTLPYFIPMPFGPFGTLGAFISMKAPPPNRRALLAVAAAGPISGLAMAIPILLVGLSMSVVTPLTPNNGMVMEGNSILYAALKYISFGKILPGGGEDVFLHPIAFAGWAGLLVTGLNLLPAGQLDGGHIIYSLLGDKARYLSIPVIGVLLALGILWSGWFLWAMLILVFGRQYAAPLDDVTRLTSTQRVIAWLVVIVFVLVFTPMPLTIY